MYKHCGDLLVEHFQNGFNDFNISVALILLGTIEKYEEKKNELCEIM